MREQLRKQLDRIRELRVKKVEEPGITFVDCHPSSSSNMFLDAFYGTEDPTLHNVDVMTDVSMPATAFTRYTAAPSTMSRTSKYVDITCKRMTMLTLGTEGVRVQRENWREKLVQAAKEQ